VVPIKLAIKILRGEFSATGLSLLAVDMVWLLLGGRLGDTPWADVSKTAA
jgi:hypothetical protein